MTRDPKGVSGSLASVSTLAGAKPKGGRMEQATRTVWAAEAHERAALEHEDLARQWIAVGERRHAQLELSRTEIHRRAAAIKRELAAAETAGV